MCLVMDSREDQRLLNKLRGKGHVLVKGWKLVRRVDHGRVRSLLQLYYWKSGWNIATSGWRLKPLSIRKHKKLKTVPRWRSIYAGIHIYLDRPSLVSWHEDQAIRMVWFYADEARGAAEGSSGGGYNRSKRTVVVNRVLMRRAY